MVHSSQIQRSFGTKTCRTQITLYLLKSTLTGLYCRTAHRALRLKTQQLRCCLVLHLFWFMAEASSNASALKGHRPVYFEAASGYTDTAIYDRAHLRPGEGYRGPAIIEEKETSIVTGPDTRFHLDATANIIIDFEE
jgi:hypothetical protein